MASLAAVAIGRSPRNDGLTNVYFALFHMKVYRSYEGVFHIYASNIKYICSLGTHRRVRIQSAVSISVHSLLWYHIVASDLLMLGRI